MILLRIGNTAGVGQLAQGSGLEGTEPLHELRFHLLQKTPAVGLFSYEVLPVVAVIDEVADLPGAYVDVVAVRAPVASGARARQSPR